MGPGPVPLRRAATAVFCDDRELSHLRCKRFRDALGAFQRLTDDRAKADREEGEWSRPYRNEQLAPKEAASADVHSSGFVPS